MTERQGPTPDDGPSTGSAPEEVSLERLREAYAQLVGAAPPPPREEPESADAAGAEPPEAVDPLGPEVEAAAPLSPRSILEAILFVGRPNNQPISAREAAAVMRGVQPGEIPGLVQELNDQYAAERRPYHIVSAGGGFRLELRPEFHGLKAAYYGRVREARLSQAAIDVLAIVAYNQPICREAVDQLRGKPSGAVLRQLVRRRLLQVETRAAKRRTLVYRTTDRFLDLFGLESLAELPQAQQLEPP